jgi:hypothetical protein
MYLLINKSINSIIKKINLMRAKKCIIGYYPTTIHRKAFINVVYKVVTPLIKAWLLPTYYPLLPFQGNYLKKAYNTLTINQLNKKCR